MTISADTVRRLDVALTRPAATKELTDAIAAAATGNSPSTFINVSSGYKVNSVQVVGTQSTAVTPVAVTFSANAPATYGTPTGALTVADGATPTVVELVKYCNELRGNIVALQAVLHHHGLTT